MKRFKQTIIVVILSMLLALAACRERDLSENLPPDLPGSTNVDGQNAGSDDGVVAPGGSTDGNGVDSAGGGEVDPAAGGDQPAVDAPTDGNGTENSGEQPAAEPEQTPTEGGEGDSSGAGSENPDNSGGEQNVDSGGDSNGEENAAETTIHIVKQGDSVGQIAKQYNVTIEDIAAANNLADVNRITAGDELRIVPGAAAAQPEPETDSPGETVDEVGSGFDPNNYRIHVVSRGDTLFEIGLAYGFTVEELAQYNGITDINRIDIGDEIRIPIR